MTKYKRKAVFRPKRLDFSIDAKLTTKGKRYRIQVANLHKNDLTVMQGPTKWERFRITNDMILLVTRATRETDFQLKGDWVYMLKFKDGRTVRLYRREMTKRIGVKISCIMNRFEKLR